ncbi:hypothetical protein WA588_004207 [Blastocystis sp. NMH]
MLGEKVKIALVVTAYFVISISMVLMNKTLLSKDHSIPAPFFVTWYQCVLTSIICWVLGLMGKNTDSSSCLHQFPEQHYDIRVAMSILPLSLVFVSMISFNNLCLKYVPVSFYLVARSLTIVFNVVLSYLFLHIRTSFKVILCCLVVIFGFFIGAEGEINFSLIGTIFGVMSSLFVSLNSIYTKKMIPIVDNNSWKLCFYNNTNSIILFIPLIIIFERNTLWEYASRFSSSFFWLVMNLAGIFGFLIGIVTIAQIRLTSPLTHNISGTAKACVQTLVAVLFLGDKMSMRSAFGTFCVLFGSFMYSLVRSHEMDREKAQKEKDSILNKNQPVVSEGSSEDKPLLPVKSVNWSVSSYSSYFNYYALNKHKPPTR